eukprot:CAMPEP_0116866506 /NCGR_PEP_ID=MMETSP0418-20121206/26059_1 /TAXON_ID=1158023 /ORGANISM="Astrosyne radiata, Strain 13vi08-1A" /LENGTH=217 /DNA_ID=CAMNT_0004502133 /DNA_START=53 /DNA_END=703 /DNA_ORIENTATION=+
MMSSPKSRGVYFASAAPVAAPIPQWYTNAEEDPQRQQAWWSPQDFGAMQASAHHVADSIATENDSILTPRHRRSYLKTLRKIDYICQQEEGGLDECSSWFHDLVFWTKVGHERRGLERFALKKSYRKQRKILIREAVYFVQAACQTQPIGYDQQSAMVRVASETVSTPAAKLARVMGAADEAAARCEYKVEPSRDEMILDTGRMKATGQGSIHENDW